MPKLDIPLLSECETHLFRAFGYMDRKHFLFLIVVTQLLTAIKRLDGTCPFPLIDLYGYDRTPPDLSEPDDRSHFDLDF